MRRPSRQGLLRVWTYIKALSVAVLLEPPAKEQSCSFYYTSADNHHNVHHAYHKSWPSVFIFFLLAIALTSCDEAEEVQQEKPNLTITYLHVGSQTLTADVNIQSFGSQPIKEYGIIYGELPGLDIGGNKISFSDDKQKVVTCRLTDLKVNTTYYIRAYIASVDNTVTYSPELSATTSFQTPQNFSPRSATIYDEVTIYGTNFEPLGTRLFVDDILADAQVTPEAIKFFPPFGIQSDSVSLSIEIGGVKFSMPNKLHYRPGRWTRLKPYEDERISFMSRAVGITGKLYVTSRNDFVRPNVIREFDPSTEQWRDIAVHSNGHNQLMQCFAIYRQIFIVADNDTFVMYDLDADQWHTLPPHPTGSCQSYSGIAFSIHNNGYVALGESNHEVWRYNGKGFNWTRLRDFPGDGTSCGLALTTAEAVYYFGGLRDSADGDVLSRETWKYDPIADTWEQRSGYPGNGTVWLNGISLNNKLYVGGGGDAFNASEFYNDFWEYDPETDKWRRIIDLPVSRRNMYTYSFGNDGYLGSGEAEQNRWYYDVWKFEMD